MPTFHLRSRFSALLGFLLSFFTPLFCAAQDERFWRAMVEGTLQKNATALPSYQADLPVRIEVKSSRYVFDLDSDGQKEYLQVTQKDGRPGLHITTEFGDTLFTTTFPVHGTLASVDKLRLVDVSEKWRTLIIYLKEGQTSGHKFESTARLWFLSFPKAEMKKMHLQPGPFFWHEFEGHREQYAQRRYALSMTDLDQDGFKEIRTSHQNSGFVWKFDPERRWYSF